MTSFDYLSLALLILFAVANWFLPRHFGVTGMVFVHGVLVLAYFWLTSVAMRNGTYEYDGLPSLIGLLVQPILLNCMLLPIAIAALWRRAAVQRRRRREASLRGFSVITASGESR